MWTLRAKGKGEGKQRWWLGVLVDSASILEHSLPSKRHQISQQASSQSVSQLACYLLSPILNTQLRSLLQWSVIHSISHPSVTLRLPVCQPVSLQMCCVISKIQFIYLVRKEERLNIDNCRECFLDFSHDDVIFLFDFCCWGLWILHFKKSKEE